MEFYVVHFDPQVFSESDVAKKMEGKEENSQLTSADSPEVLTPELAALLCSQS